MKCPIKKVVILFMLIVSIITGITGPYDKFTGISFAEIINNESIYYASEGSYAYYLSLHKDMPKPSENIVIPVEAYTETNMIVDVHENYAGIIGKSVLTQEEGYIEWRFDVKYAGMYNMKIEYYPVEGRGCDIERKIYINGEIPFGDAERITFSRVWKNKTEILRDSRGNDIRPSQVESPLWQTIYVSDPMGYYSQPYYFYLNKGVNTLKLESVAEPMLIKTIEFLQAPEVENYETVMRMYAEKGLSPVNKEEYIEIQGEDAIYKSSPTIYPIYDRTSPATKPSDVSKLRLNIIGGTGWMLPGQWAIWEFEVNEPGLYQINLRARQNTLRGLFCNRKLYIDGKVPFKEVESIPFKYDSKWQVVVLGEDNSPYLFYFEKGKHQLKLEVTLGRLGEILQSAEQSLYNLNNIYRKILMITGANPDIYRDYQLEKVIPEVIEDMKVQSGILGALAMELMDYTQQRGSEAAILEQLTRQLKDLAENPHTIPSRLNSLKGNVSALAQWLLNARMQPIDIDYIVIQSPDNEPPKADVGFFKKILHELKAFIASFKEDYDLTGESRKSDRSITVWVPSGRDQAQVLKSMIDDTFTVKTGIRVDLKLVDSSVLLPATVAGNGPDVAVQVGNSEPVNYAARKAVYDVGSFDDFNDISKRFHESAIVPYRFNGGIYALPETQSFPMLFYRKDILDELGLQVPQTWDDLIRILPKIQKNNMDFVMPVSETSAAGAGLSAYAMFLFQEGGELYRGEGIVSGLHSKEAIEAFNKWTNFYISYKLPLQTNIANRFRIGEVPLAISDYQLFNTLIVFAPEIRGLWSMAPVPGKLSPDGSLDRSVAGSGTAVIMLSRVTDAEAAWEFMKWWTSTETQVRFGKEMESLMGAAARYPTANIEAMSMLPWPRDIYRNLQEQWEWVKGIPEVPGGYFTPRHLDNAFRAVVYHGSDYRETLLEYVRVINEEITAKRIEFGLEVADGKGYSE